MENNKKNNNKTVIVAIAALAIIGIVAGTYAYFTSSAQVENHFTATSYETEIQRTLLDSEKLQPGDTITVTSLNVKNLGERNISVRAKIVEDITAADTTTKLALNLTSNSTTNSYWTDSDTATSGATNATDAIVKTLNSSWEKGSDGYYYYKGVVTPNNATTNLIDTLLINTALRNVATCDYTTKEAGDAAYTDTDTNEFTGDTDGRRSGNVKCSSSTSAGYASSVYTLKVTFDTIQSSAVASQWTAAPAAAQEAAASATDVYPAS